MKFFSLKNDEDKLLMLMLTVQKNSKKAMLPVVALVVAGIGVNLLYGSMAATPAISLEAENGTASNGAVAIADSTASNGRAVQFKTPGTNPSPTPSPTPPPTAPPASGCSGPTVTLTGTTASKYTNASPAAGTTFNLTSWLTTAVTGPGNNSGFDIGMGNAPGSLCVVGGVIHGTISPASNWTYVHDTVGGFGFRVGTSGRQTLTNIRVHDVEDGLKPRECATSADSCDVFTGKGSFLLDRAYMTAIRDDAIEDDDFLAGTIQDSLFDGIWTFLSEQQQRSTGNGVSPGESTTINVTNSYVRLMTTNGGETGGGKWFKWQGSTSHHTLVITDSVFAVDKMPRSGWSSLSIPAGTAWKGTNYILWLGTAGGYGGPKPAGVTFIEGQAAKDKWNTVRNTWLSAHGYATKAADDFISMDDPVVAPR